MQSLKMKDIVRLWEESSVGKQYLVVKLEELAEKAKGRKANAQEEWFGEAHRDSDIKITIICPATDIHIRKVCASSAPFSLELSFLLYPIVYQTRADPGSRNACSLRKIYETIHTGISCRSYEMVDTSIADIYES